VKLSTYTITRVVKEKGGKYVSIEVGTDKYCTINNARITGDFFAFPPEVIDEIEKYLKGRRVTRSLIETIMSLINSAVLLGVSREKFQSLLINVLEEVSKACKVNAEN